MSAQTESEYVLDGPNETKRLGYQHEIIKDAMPGKRLLIFPVNVSGPPLRVLDSATADGKHLTSMRRSYGSGLTHSPRPGTWLRDIAQYLPAGSTLVGTDLVEHFFPPAVDRGNNITLEIQDITKPWPAEWEQSFDIAHQRLALPAAGPNGQAIVTSFANLVKPGGWIQLFEGDVYASHADNGVAANQFISLMRSAFTMMNSPKTLVHHLSGWLKAAGFENVEEHSVLPKLGANNSNADLVKKALFSNGVAATGLVAMAKSMPSLQLEFERSELDTLGARLEIELREHEMILPLTVVTGRRPL